jgi:hypothetical protein
MALIPCGRQILGADRGLMKGLYVDAAMILCERHVGIEGINSLAVIHAESAYPVSPQLPKIHVEGAVLLQQEEDVFNYR